jgi:hypothetical protein
VICENDCNRSSVSISFLYIWYFSLFLSYSINQLSVYYILTALCALTKVVTITKATSSQHVVLHRMFGLKPIKSF